MPVPFSKALAGKNIAAAVFICIEVCFVVLVTLIFRIHLVPIKILEALAVSLTAGLYLLSVGNLSSVHFPRPMTPEKVTQGGAARSLNALVFLFFPLALAPIGLAYWARYVFDSQAIFFAILALAALVGGSLCIPGRDPLRRFRRLRQVQYVNRLVPRFRCVLVLQRLHVGHALSVGRDRRLAVFRHGRNGIQDLIDFALSESGRRKNDDE